MERHKVTLKGVVGVEPTVADLQSAALATWLQPPYLTQPSGTPKVGIR